MAIAPTTPRATPASTASTNLWFVFMGSFPLFVFVLKHERYSIIRDVSPSNSLETCNPAASKAKMPAYVHRDRNGAVSWMLHHLPLYEEEARLSSWAFPI